MVLKWKMQKFSPISMKPLRKWIWRVVAAITTFLCLEDLRRVRDSHNLGAMIQIKKPMKIVGFWHIGESFQPHEEARDAFVIKQAKEIMNSYLFSKEGLESGNYTLELHYVTTVKLSKATKSFLHRASDGLIREHPPTVLRMDPEEEYFEFPTLAELHSHCRKKENEGNVVFYIHSKTKDAPRIEMEDYLLGKTCVTCLSRERKLACGPNLVGTGWTWSHFGGNFWMTRCSHISTLNFPFYEGLLEEANNGMTSKQQSEAYPPYGRLFAEYWMFNDSGLRMSYRGKEVPIEMRRGLIPLDRVCSFRAHYVSPEDNSKFVFYFA